MTTPTTRRHSRAHRMALCAAPLVLLSGCGGGGGSSAPPPPPTPVETPRQIEILAARQQQTLQPFSPRAPLAKDLSFPDPSGFSSRKAEYEAFSEYKLEWNDCGGQPCTTANFSQNKFHADNRLSLINASAAYARGATGAGEIVGVTDSGIADWHQEFFLLEDGTSTGSKVTFAEADGDYVPINLEKTHGTAVAALVAGTRNGQPPGTGNHPAWNMHGVAFDATLLFREVDVSTSGPFAGFTVDLSIWDEARDKRHAAFIDIDYAREAGAAIVNHSFALHGDIDRYHPDQVRAKLKHTAANLAQKDIADEDKTIVVWSAGNDGAAVLLGEGRISNSVTLLAGLGVDFPELQSHVLTVVAVGQDGVIAGFSNHCGIAKAFCLAAPGVAVLTANFHPVILRQYRQFNGTSASAPLVSGSLAVMRQFFKRQLGNTELVTRLLATANREGIYDDSDIYGHGLVDLDAATAPVGQMMTSLSGDPLARPFTGGGFAQSGGAFGAAMQNGLDGVEIAAFDQLDAPFFFPVTGGTAPRISAAYDMNLREHEIALGGGVSQSASLSLMTDGGELSSARL
ncbi:MAG: S8 family serine peptidase, partial [Gammaproteobacteria bacterium]